MSLFRFSPPKFFARTYTRREFLPFEEARSYVRSLGLKKYTEWADYSKSGNRPRNIPSAPSVMYANQGWINFFDWLNDGADAGILPTKLSSTTIHKRESLLRGFKTRDYLIEFVQSLSIAPDIEFLALRPGGSANLLYRIQSSQESGEVSSPKSENYVNLTEEHSSKLWIPLQVKVAVADPRSVGRENRKYSMYSVSTNANVNVIGFCGEIEDPRIYTLSTSRDLSRRSMYFCESKSLEKDEIIPILRKW